MPRRLFILGRWWWARPCSLPRSHRPAPGHARGCRAEEITVPSDAIPPKSCWSTRGLTGLPYAWGPYPVFPSRPMASILCLASWATVHTMPLVRPSAQHPYSGKRTGHKARPMETACSPSGHQLLVFTPTSRPPRRGVCPLPRRCLNSDPISGLWALLPPEWKNSLSERKLTRGRHCQTLFVNRFTFRTKVNAIKCNGN